MRTEPKKFLYEHERKPQWGCNKDGTNNLGEIKHAHFSEEKKLTCPYWGGGVESLELELVNERHCR